MSREMQRQSSDEAQAALLAVLAASRELGPEMDTALAESYLRQHPVAPEYPARDAVRREAGLMPPPRASLGSIGLLLAVVLVAAALLASGGHAFWLFWMFWLPVVLFGRWWRGWPLYHTWAGPGSYRESQRS